MRDYSILMMAAATLLCALFLVVLRLLVPPAARGPIVIPPCDTAHIGFRVTTKPFEDPTTRWVCTGVAWTLETLQDDTPAALPTTPQH